MYREFAPSLLRYLKARGAPDPENTLGEVFVQVVQKLPYFHGKESDFRAWLFTVARNRLIDEVRYRDRRPTDKALDLTQEIAAADPDTATASSTQLKQAQILEILSHLTSEQRDVLFLRILAGLTIEETAQVLGKTGGSVKRLQSRGLKSLRKKIVQGVVSL